MALFTEIIPRGRFASLSPNTVLDELKSIPQTVACEIDDAGDYVVSYEREDMDEFFMHYPLVMSRLEKAVRYKNEPVEVEDFKRRPTVVVNVFGGPGAGKTTAAHRIYAELSDRGYLVEYAPEYAKDLAWAIDNPNCSVDEQDHARRLLDGSFDNQLAVYKTQRNKVDRLDGLVDFIITDSPAILSCIYMKEKDTPRARQFQKEALEHFKEQNNFNFVVKREGEYETRGRVQNAEEALEIDKQLGTFLKTNNIYHGTYARDKMEVAVKNMQTTHARAQREFEKEQLHPFPHPSEFKRKEVGDRDVFTWQSEDKSINVTITHPTEQGWACEVNEKDHQPFVTYGESFEQVYCKGFSEKNQEHRSAGERGFGIDDPTLGIVTGLAGVGVLTSWDKAMFGAVQSSVLEPAVGITAGVALNNKLTR